MEYGLQVENLNHEPDDHLGLEFAFLSSLALRAISALEDGDNQSFEKILKGMNEFAVQHIINWVPQWCELVINNSQTDFFTGIAMLVSGLLKDIQCVIDCPEVV